MTGSVETVRGLEIDPSYLRSVIEALCGIGSSPLGYRTTGTPEDAAVAGFVESRMRAIGLSDVAVEDVTVDAWRFLDASVTVDGDSSRISASGWGGVPGTGPDGVRGPLVYLRDARRRFLDKQDLAGAVVLVDWRGPHFDPPAVVLELARRGALAMVMTCPAGGAWYQSPHALGAFNASWPADGLPMVYIAKETAARLRNDHLGHNVTVTLLVEQTPRAAGHNVVGYLPGERAGPIVVGAHHDAWFRGAFDNTSGVAAMLGLAGGLVASGFRPRHTVCFTSRTAEEYGISGSVYDWCIGAWEQVQRTHPEWREQSPFALCLEASGHRGLRSVIEAPVELAGWARRVGRGGAAQGWAPTGRRISPPVAGTEQWPYLISGVPGVAAYQWEKQFGRTDYHTQHDTISLLDFDVLAAQTRLYGLLLLEADRDPDAILDHSARAAQLAAIAAEFGHPALAEAARRQQRVQGRAAFTAVGQKLFALTAQTHATYPHVQAAADLRALDAALAAITAQDNRAAATSLRGVGRNSLAAFLSADVFDAHSDRFRPDQLSRSWAAGSHLTQSPRLWSEIATLLGEAGARPFGPWLADSLRAARHGAAAELARRLDAMADA